MLAVLQSLLARLNARVTETRMTKLDGLDTRVTEARLQKIDDLDSRVTGARMTHIDALEGRLTSARAGKIDTILDNRLTDARMGRIDTIEGRVTAARMDRIDTIESRLTAARAGKLDFLPGATPRQYKSQLFTASGTWVRPAGVNVVYVTIQAPGGGGGGSARSSGRTQGGQGGGSGAACVRVPQHVTGNIAVTVGAPGSGGSGRTGSYGVGTSGTAGGACQFRWLSAEGGAGGNRANQTSGGNPDPSGEPAARWPGTMAAQTAVNQPAAAVGQFYSGILGPVSANEAALGVAQAYSSAPDTYSGRPGAGSLFGRGGAYANENSNGKVPGANEYGGGGSGGGGSGGGNLDGHPGGNGAPGFVLVEWWE